MLSRVRATRPSYCGSAEPVDYMGAGGHGERFRDGDDCEQRRAKPRRQSGREAVRLARGPLCSCGSVVCQTESLRAATAPISVGAVAGVRQIR